MEGKYTALDAALDLVWLDFGGLDKQRSAWNPAWQRPGDVHTCEMVIAELCREIRVSTKQQQQQDAFKT